MPFVPCVHVEPHNCFSPIPNVPRPAAWTQPCTQAAGNSTAFSCKDRWFCPSCHSKKTIQFGEDVPDHILYPVPYRQLIFSIPILVARLFQVRRQAPDAIVPLCQRTSGYLLSNHAGPR